jgi:bromodomain adjacent to zinc finger domain protein 1A
MPLNSLVCRYHARIQKVYPPKVMSDIDLQSASFPQQLPNVRPHMIGGDLGIPAKEINSEDDPIKYYYRVQLLELEKDKSHDRHKKVAGKEGEKTGSITEVQSSLMRWDVRLL